MHGEFNVEWVIPVPQPKHVLNMFLGAVDFETDSEELQAELPYPTDHDALLILAESERWSSKSRDILLFHTIYCLLFFKMSMDSA